MRAKILAAGHRHAGWRRRPCLGLAHRAQLQRAERCETAGGETGVAQEAATIKIARRLIMRRRRSKRSAANGMLSSLDQHGSPLSLGGVAIDAIKILNFR
jgi:hypothetical protein